MTGLLGLRLANKGYLSGYTILIAMLLTAYFTANEKVNGWGCGLAFLYAAIFEPLARFLAVVIFDYHEGFPELDTTITMQILLGMLGLGAMRSQDKKHGVDTKEHRYWQIFHNFKLM